MATEAQQHLAILSARGWSYRQIGKVVERDASLIRQGALGKKPLNNLLPALERLVETGKGPSAVYTEHIEVPRRQRATNGEAATRGHPRPRPQAPAKVGERRILPNGQIYERVRSTAQASSFFAALPSDRQHITISYRGGDGKWHKLGQKNGYNVANLQKHLIGPRGGKRSWLALVRALAAEVYEGEAAEVVSAIELNTTR
jgi:hypothetical protein